MKFSWSRSLIAGALALWASTCAAGGADAPIGLAGTRPASGGRVIIPMAATRPSCPTRQVAPSGAVTYWFHGPGPLVAVCTTFPGAVLLDRKGNVYKQPVVTDAQGRERAVGPPAPLAPLKHSSGTTTAKP